MALITLKVFSESLGKQTDINVIIPQSRNRGQRQLLYLYC